MTRRIVHKRKANRGYTGPSAAATAIVVLLTLAVLTIITGGVAVATAYSYYARDLPSPDRLQDRQVFRSTKILDRKGNLLYELFDPQGGKRTSVKLAEIAPAVVKATVAIEDATFYENPGISPRGTLRAIIANLRGEEIQGGSTITQQLIKRVLLTSEVSIERKIQEWILAYRVNQQYTKEQILEWYLNEVPYGNMAYGIEAAAESYFGKSAKELDLAESAMLAGIPQAPSLLSPVIDPSAAKRRQAMVLDAMVRQGDITEELAQAATRQPLYYQAMKFGLEAPHFVMYVRELLERKYDARTLYSGGLEVTTSIDLDMQRIAERVARQRVDGLTKFNIHNAALVALRPDTGEILTMLGSVDYFDRDISGQVNIATSERQPGSTFKPITYAAAFSKGWGPGTVVLDAFTVFQDRNKRPYTPKNVDKKWHGPVTLRTALANSMNVPAVKTIEFVGVKNTLAQAHQMGITSLNREDDYDLSLTLGAGEVKLLDLAYAYSAFATGGSLYGRPVSQDQQRMGYRTVEPVAILKVEDASGKILEEFSGPQRAEVVNPQIAYQMTSILSDNNARSLLFGPDSPLKLNRPAAAKTGTTEENLDLWTVGYTPDLVAGVWVGNSDNSPIEPVLTTLTAAPIWHDFMQEALQATPPRDFDQPGGLEKVEICPISGLKPSRYCPTKGTDLFVKGKAPAKECDIHRLVVIDKTTGNLANDSTPPENREQKVVEVYPADWAAWAKDTGRPEAPRAAEPTPAPTAGPAERRDTTSTLVIGFPLTGSAVRQTVEIRGTAAGKGFASYRVEYGEGLSPTAWTPIGATHMTTVENNLLERWDTRSLNGVYRLRITLVEQSPPVPPKPAATTQPGQPAPTAVLFPPGPPPAPKVLEVPVIVDNTPPTVTITSPRDGSSFKRDQMERVTLSAQVSDNHRMASTDFFVDDKPVGSSTATPATVDWRPVVGSHVLRAVARDSAGNETRSADIKLTIQ